MVVALLLGLAAQAAPVNAEPIELRHTRPAAEVTLHQSSTCGEQVFEISYTQTGEGVVGTVLVRDGETIVRLDSVQADLFDHLSHLSSASVSCGDETLPSTILISGTDRHSGEFGQVYSLGYLPSAGFSTVSAI